MEEFKYTVLIKSVQYVKKCLHIFCIEIDGFRLKKKIKIRKK